MDKNEILEKSRQENSKIDEFEKDINVKSARIALIVAAILLGIFIFIEENNSYLIILDAMCGALWSYKACKLQKKSDIILAVVWIVIFVLNFAVYIADKCGL